ncbi:hypothetical protein ACTWPB_23665 [Nocardia sp. IBHARD005]|uniref:hypothetical protein n=1 Tax=Nocardia sp. IBHARD005 TaxID=3457765 RepID=UPI00405819E7
MFAQAEGFRALGGRAYFAERPSSASRTKHRIGEVVAFGSMPPMGIPPRVGWIADQSGQSMIEAIMSNKNEQEEKIEKEQVEREEERRRLQEEEDRRLQ